MINLERWEIDPDDYNVLIDNLMLMLIPFLSRLIKNKERESLTETVGTIETAKITDNSKEGPKMFNGGK